MSANAVMRSGSTSSQVSVMLTIVVFTPRLLTSITEFKSRPSGSIALSAAIISRGLPSPTPISEPLSLETPDPRTSSQCATVPAKAISSQSICSISLPSKSIGLRPAEPGKASIRIVTRKPQKIDGNSSRFGRMYRPSFEKNFLSPSYDTIGTMSSIRSSSSRTTTVAASLGEVGAAASFGEVGAVASLGEVGATATCGEVGAVASPFGTTGDVLPVLTSADVSMATDVSMAVDASTAGFSESFAVVFVASDASADVSMAVENSVVGFSETVVVVCMASDVSTDNGSVVSEDSTTVVSLTTSVSSAGFSSAACFSEVTLSMASTVAFSSTAVFSAVDCSSTAMSSAADGFSDFSTWATATSFLSAVSLAFFSTAADASVLTLVASTGASSLSAATSRSAASGCSRFTGLKWRQLLSFSS
mmetsp:Transcript_45177/g.72131  ORF Transcript_45177/g.72131 Transcript_45177/m.72131 type:complete len:419 (-) Transcript_45177:378-1634(-)